MNDYEKLAVIVAKAKEQDVNAFQQLYESTHQALYFLVLKRVGNPTAAEDIVQEAYVTAYTNLHKLKNDLVFIQWLNQIAFHKVQDYFRQLKADKRFEGLNLDDEENFVDIVDDFLIEDDYLQKENREEILQLVSELPEKQRHAVYMFYFQQFSAAEMAEICGCSENIICKRLFDARNTIKKKLTQKEGVERHG